MPTYTYQCPTCGKTTDRRCSIAARDSQQLPIAECLADDPDTKAKCTGALAREEIPADQARCSHQWAEWQR